MKSNILEFRARKPYMWRDRVSYGIVCTLVVFILGVVLGFLLDAFGLSATLRIIAGAGAFALSGIGWRSLRYDKIEIAVPAFCFAVALLAFAILGPMVFSEHDRPAPHGAIDQERAQIFRDAGLAPERPRR